MLLDQFGRQGERSIMHGDVLLGRSRRLIEDYEILCAGGSDRSPVRSWDLADIARVETIEPPLDGSTTMVMRLRAATRQWGGAG